MNKIYLFIFITVFLFKTETVFSGNKTFNVDNIIINNSNNLNKQELLDKAFKKGFQNLSRKILQNIDVQKIVNTELVEIKKLILSYQIKKNKKNKTNSDVTINLSFNREKINNFFYNRNIQYADIQKTDLVLFPVLVENNNFYLFTENYFFNQWNKKKNKNFDEFINYFLPIENLEDIRSINQNKENLESMDAKAILAQYNLSDYIFLIIKPTKKETDVFLKGVISGNKIIKNLKISKVNKDKNINYENTIKEIKTQISELWKSQNLIDVRTPSFLNITLDLKKNNDLLKLQNILDNIDLIVNYQVLELNKEYAKIKIKYLGKINKIKSKLDQNKIKVIILDNQWKLKLI